MAQTVSTNKEANRTLWARADGHCPKSLSGRHSFILPTNDFPYCSHCWANLYYPQPEPLQLPVAIRQEQLLKDLERDLIVECERAMKQRDLAINTGISNAAKGTHDTMFGEILKKYFVVQK